MKLTFLLGILLSAQVACGLYISLVEERPHSRGWHFGLLLHDRTRITGRPMAMVEQALIQNRTPGSGERVMKYDPAVRPVQQSQLVVTVGPLIAKGIPNDDALEARILAILERIPPYVISAKGFKNCLDFALEAVKRLRDEGLMTSKQYEKFWEYHRKLSPEVRRYTNENILRICGKSTKTGPACSTGVKKPGSKNPVGRKRAKLRRGLRT